MDEERFNELEKKVNYFNEEGFVGGNRQLMLFKNSNAFIEAIRSNKVPGIKWTEEDEKKWQLEALLEKTSDVKKCN